MFLSLSVLCFTIAFGANTWIEMAGSGKQYLYRPQCVSDQSAANSMCIRVVGSGLAIASTQSIRTFLTDTVYDGTAPYGTPYPTGTCASWSGFWTDGELNFVTSSVSFSNGETEAFGAITWDNGNICPWNDIEPNNHGNPTCFGFRRCSKEWHSVICSNEENAYFCERCKYIYYDDGSYKTWQEAYDICSRDGLALATIITPSEKECALSVIKDAAGSSVWIGLNSLSSGDISDFIYDDGTDCSVPNNGKFGQCVFNDWWYIKGRPRCPEGHNNEDGSRCVRLRADDGKFDNDIKCDDHYAITGVLCNNLNEFCSRCGMEL